MQVIADSYLAGVSTRRFDQLVKQLGLDGISTSRPQHQRREAYGRCSTPW